MYVGSFKDSGRCPLESQSRCWTGHDVRASTRNTGHDWSLNQAWRISLTHHTCEPGLSQGLRVKSEGFAVCAVGRQFVAPAGPFPTPRTPKIPKART